MTIISINQKTFILPPILTFYVLILHLKIGPSTVPFYRYYFDLFLDFIFRRIYKSTLRLPPKKSNSSLLLIRPIIDESALSLARKIRYKDLKCEQVVRAFINRCQEVNAILNAIVDDRFVDAINEARDLDYKIKNGNVTENYFNAHPLLGVPFTVSEMLPCEGMKWSLGLLSRQDVVAISDANAVGLMKEAGGILIGVTNISQVGFWTETYNPVYGFTRNPYEIYKSVGGSCGGEACIVAACGSPIGIGIDFGGCLRIPANRCGVFTHKSSPKLISIQGNPLFSNSTENNIAVIGPIVKYSEDLSFIISILTKLDVSRFLFDDDIQSRNIQYFYSSRSLCGYASPVRKEVENNIKKIVNELNRYSVNEAISLEIDETVDTIPIWGYKLAECNSDFKELMRNEKNEEIRPIREAINYFFGKREYCLYTIYNLLGLIAIKPTNDDQLKQVLDKIKDIFLDILGDHSVLLFPTEPLPLGYPYESLLRPHNNSYCALWSALEFPVTQVPVGLIKGCPMGVQIVAGPYNDHLCLAAARTLELLLGGYKEPSS